MLNRAHMQNWRHRTLMFSMYIPTETTQIVYEHQLQGLIFNTDMPLHITGTFGYASDSRDGICLFVLKHG